MSASGYTPILSYGSITPTNVPLAANLTTSASGVELAINAADGKLFYKDSGGVVQILATKGSAVIGGSTTQVQYNSSGALAGSANLTFDGTTLTAAGLAGPHNGTVGATTPNTGAFTTLAASGAVTLSGGTANGITYLNGSKVLTSGSALTFDGTTLGVAAVKSTGALALSSSGAGTAINLNIGSSELARLSGNTNGVFTVGGEGSVGGLGNAYATLGAYGANGGGFRIYRGTGAGTPTAIFYADNSGTFLGSAENTPLVFSQNNNEGMRLTSTGLGIGTSSPGAKLHSNNSSSGATALTAIFGNGAAAALNNGSAIFLNNSSSFSASTYSARIASVITNGTTQASDLIFSLYNGSSANDLMRLDSSGNLGLGVTPSAWFASYRAMQIGGTASLFSSTSGGFDFLTSNALVGSGDAFRYIASSVPATAYRFNSGDGTHKWFTAPSGTAGNVISFTQAMTLDASGNLSVNTTGFGSKLNVSAALEVAGFQNTGGTGNVRFFNNAGSTIGYIQWTGSTTSYITSSDYRLKNITGPITTSGAYIDSLNPVEGTWKADGSTFVGLIAHEAQEVSRTQVATGEKDGEEMQGMSYSSSEMIANLIAELQSVRKRLAALEAA